MESWWCSPLRWSGSLDSAHRQTSLTNLLGYEGYCGVDPATVVKAMSWIFFGLCCSYEVDKCPFTIRFVAPNNFRGFPSQIDHIISLYGPLSSSVHHSEIRLSNCRILDRRANRRSLIYIIRLAPTFDVAFARKIWQLQHHCQSYRDLKF